MFEGLLLLITVLLVSPYAHAQPKLEKKKAMVADEWTEEDEAIAEANEAKKREALKRKRHIKSQPDSQKPLVHTSTHHHKKKMIENIPSPNENKPTGKITLRNGEDISIRKDLSYLQINFLDELLEEGLLDAWDQIPLNEEVKLRKVYRREVGADGNEHPKREVKHHFVDWEITLPNGKTKLITRYTGDTELKAETIVDKIHDTLILPNERIIHSYKFKKIETPNGNPEFVLNGKTFTLEVVSDVKTDSYRTKGATRATAEKIKEFQFADTRKQPKLPSTIKGCFNHFYKRFIIASLVVGAASVTPKAVEIYENYNQDKIIQENKPHYEYSVEDLETELEKTIKEVDPDGRSKEIVEFLKKNQSKLKAGHFVFLYERYQYTIINGFRLEPSPIYPDVENVLNRLLEEKYKKGIITKMDLAWNLDLLPSPALRFLNYEDMADILEVAKKFDQNLNPITSRLKADDKKLTQSFTEPEYKYNRVQAKILSIIQSNDYLSKYGNSYYPEKSVYLRIKNNLDGENRKSFIEIYRVIYSP